MNARIPLALLVTILASLFVSSRAFAMRPADEEFERQVQSELAAIDPSAVDVLRDADRARDAHDLDKAAAGYREVLTRAPGFYHAERRLCGVEVARGHRDEGIALCRSALARKETADNHAALATALVMGERPSSTELNSARTHADKAARMAPDSPHTQATLCKVAYVGDDLPGLQSCSQALIRIDDGDASGHLFATLAAAGQGHFGEAYAELDKAHARGLPDPMYAELKSKLEDNEPMMPRIARWGGLTLASWLALFALLFASGSLLSRSALRAASRVPDSKTGHAHGVDALLRRAYRLVLWIACGFYYVSLPLLALFMIALGVAVGYAVLYVGRVPIKLVLICGLIIVSTLWAIAKSLFTRVKDADPGERIDLGEHPRLRAVLDEVAGRIGTRAVDHVYLTPFTEVAVLERGGIGSQLRGHTQRALVLGAGVLDGMNVRAFKGVLAHEYGHFHNEDTAGGGFALAVRRSMLRMAIGLAERGAASAMNPAWWFIKGFYSVFLRISQGASRLQEVLADRWAAFAYGSRAFEEGLRHVVARSVAFDAHADSTINQVVQEKAALANLYRFAPAKAPAPDDLAKAFEEAWNATPSPYDSHPRPADRIAWVRALDAEGAPPAADDGDEVWSLFSNRDALEEHMTGIVRTRVATALGVHLPAA